MDLKTFKRNISKGEIPGVCLLYGPEDYLKDRYLEMIEGRIVPEGTQQFNKTVIENSGNAGDIRSACDTMPMFSDKKLVVVHESHAFKKGGKTISGVDEITDILKNVPEHICLVFLEEEIDGRLKPTSLVKKKGCVVEFDYQKPGDLIKWVMKTLNKMGRGIGYASASKLVEYCPQGMYGIMGEMQKLVMYTEGMSGEISTEHIEAICTKSVKARIFDMIDAVAARNCSRALELLDEMIAIREPLPGILFLIARQIRQLIEMKGLMQEGADKREAAGKLKLPPFVIGKIMNQTQRFKIEELSKALQKCLEADYGIKSGRIDARMAVELLIFDIGGGS